MKKHWIPEHSPIRVPGPWHKADNEGRGSPALTASQIVCPYSSELFELFPMKTVYRRYARICALPLSAAARWPEPCRYRSSRSPGCTSPGSSSCLPPPAPQAHATRAGRHPPFPRGSPPFSVVLGCSTRGNLQTWLGCLEHKGWISTRTLSLKFSITFQISESSQVPSYFCMNSCPSKHLLPVATPRQPGVFRGHPCQGLAVLPKSPTRTGPQDPRTRACSASAQAGAAAGSAAWAQSSGQENKQEPWTKGHRAGGGEAEGIALLIRGNVTQCKAESILIFTAQPISSPQPSAELKWDQAAQEPVRTAHQMHREPRTGHLSRALLRARGGCFPP